MRYVFAIICAVFGFSDTAQAACDPSVYGSEPGEPLKRPVAAAPDVRIADGFGIVRKHALLGYMRMHPGLDFAGPMGTPVIAARGGEIVEARFKGEFGNNILIAHAGGLNTQYSHLARYAVGIALSTCVRRGDIIGYVGATGLSTGPHLHFEVQLENTAIDPLPHLEKLED
jgi:murein DD-endopeptidase MepM/ murein hydrolase activator NlpD